MAERKTPVRRKSPDKVRAEAKKRAEAKQPEPRAFSEYSQEEINALPAWEIAGIHFHGNTKITSAAQLWECFLSYVQWVEANPLLEEKVASDSGSPVRIKVAKMRAMTLAGMRTHIGVSEPTWAEWREHRSDLSGVLGYIEDTIRNQKFEGAAAGLLNASIISRDLGLVDKSEGKIDQSVNVSVKQYRAPDD